MFQQQTLVLLERSNKNFHVSNNTNGEEYREISGNSNS